MKVPADAEARINPAGIIPWPALNHVGCAEGGSIGTHRMVSSMVSWLGRVGETLADQEGTPRPLSGAVSSFKY